MILKWLSASYIYIYTCMHDMYAHTRSPCTLQISTQINKHTHINDVCAHTHSALDIYKHTNTNIRYIYIHTYICSRTCACTQGPLWQNMRAPPQAPAPLALPAHLLMPGAVNREDIQEGEECAVCMERRR